VVAVDLYSIVDTTTGDVSLVELTNHLPIFRWFPRRRQVLLTVMNLKCFNYNVVDST